MILTRPGPDIWAQNENSECPLPVHSLIIHSQGINLEYDDNNYKDIHSCKRLQVYTENSNIFIKNAKNHTFHMDMAFHLAYIQTCIDYM